MSLTVTPSDATLGATVRGIDLGAPIEDAVFREIENAWHERAVLIFPEQNIADEAQIAFSRRFGKLERNVTENNVGHNPEVIVLSNVRDDGGLYEAGSNHALFLKGNSFWHTDSSFKRVPAKASILSARTVPDIGGETEFADMRAAYDELDNDAKSELGDRIAVHSYAYSQSLVGGTGALSDDEWDNVPPVEHPIIRTHPATRRRNLYLGRHASHIVGEDLEVSRQRLRQLCENACQPPRVMKHRWQTGDIVMWDNRCVLHRGHPWPSDQARTMVRTTIAGEVGSNEWVL